MSLREEHAVAEAVRSLALRCPQRNVYELVISFNGGPKVFMLTPSQVRLLAAQTVDAITK